MASPSGKIASTSLRTVVLLREQQIVVELQKAFRERYLPEHLFYWLPTSVQAWIDLCRSSEYRNASRALEVLTKAAPEIAQRCPEIGTICGIGCGEGSKDRILIEPFGQANFIAADFSEALLEETADRVRDFTEAIWGFKLDVFEDAHLASLARLAHGMERAALFSVLGNTLGAFDVKQFPARLHKLLQAADRFLFDGEIFNESTLSGYDNPTNRRFAWGPLTGVGITEQDGRLEFATESAGDGLFAVTKHFIASRELRVNLGGEVIEIAEGEELRMSSSVKYRNESVLMGFVQSAGFDIEAKWFSSDGSFVLGLARPR